MKMNECSTERVRQYRQRQREARRTLVRCYLDAETRSKLDQLASDQPLAPCAEALLTAAIADAWSAREVQQQQECPKPEGYRRAGRELASAAGCAQLPGRRRGNVSDEGNGGRPDR